jgi:hypothetical protein
MLNTDLDIEGTRARLAAVERQLAADPDNEALRWHRFRLAMALECKEDLAVIRRRGVWGRLFLGAWARRN